MSAQRWAAISQDPKAGVSDSLPPSIELICCAHPKDFHLVGHSIGSAFRHSKNPIFSVTAVVPQGTKTNFLLSVGSVLSEEQMTMMSVLEEHQVLDAELVDTISGCFGKRKGWILQQLLKVQCVLNCAAEAALVLDADTLLLKPTLFLDRAGRQVLHVSSEWQQSYYRFVAELFPMPAPPISHVTHHMILKPSVLQEIMTRYFDGSLYRLVTRAAVFSSAQETMSPVSIDYELYAQYLRRFHPDAAVLSKFANLSVRLADPRVLDKMIAWLEISGHFRSASFHSIEA